MKIRSISKKITSYFYRDRSKLYITAGRDWNIILVATFLFLLLSFVYNYFVYIDAVVYGDRNVSSESATEKKSDIEEFKKELDQTFAYFDKKQQYHENLLKEKRDFMSLIFGSGENNEDQEVSQASTSQAEEEKTSFLEIFKSNVSNTAAVWKSVFIDLFE
ncbi:MAG: hypothetical protein KAS07_04980 [Candidatus Pacebacteria bacterium]|nr:hypothetical protein [Candidatus Paceibacterota bacterium]